MTTVTPDSRIRPWLQTVIPALRRPPKVDPDRTAADVVKARALADRRAAELKAAMVEVLVQVETRARVGLGG